MTDSDLTTPRLAIGTVFKLLANPRRRTLLSYFNDTDRTEATIPEVTTHLCTTLPDNPTPESIRTDLVHNHLPKLAACGVLDYDVRSKTIRYRDGPILEHTLALAARYDHSK